MQKESGKNVAIILSGCGVFDGSEIHEAVIAILSARKAGASVKFFAPDIPQADVVNHLSGNAEPLPREVLSESARIARGKISPLSELNAKKFDAIIFPGGFGAAKNLSSFAMDGTSCSVNADVEKAIADDKSERRRRVRDEMTREEARKIGSEIHMIVVQSGKDSADDEIVRIAEPMSLAITHDIPLSARLIEKGITVIDDRGNTLSAENIRKRLSERESNARFREMGLFTDKSKHFDERTIREFSAAFDRAIVALERLS